MHWTEYKTIWHVRCLVSAVRHLWTRCIGVNSYWAAGLEPPTFGDQWARLLASPHFLIGVFALFITMTAKKITSFDINL